MTGRRSQYKIQRIIDEYGLSGLGERLENYWLGNGTSKYSLRELSDLVNREILAAELEASNEMASEREVRTIYEVLTTDDVSAGERTETEVRLENNGTDVDELRSDFVSYQAVRTYLTEGRDVTYETDDAEKSIDQYVQTIQRLKGRLRSVSDEKISQLDSTDRIDVGEFSLMIDVRVYCEDCSEQYNAIDFLQDGGCGC